MFLTPRFVPQAHRLEASVSFGTGRLRCTRGRFSGATKIVTDLGRSRNHIWCVCVEIGFVRLAVRGANAPTYLVVARFIRRGDHIVGLEEKRYIRPSALAGWVTMRSLIAV